MDRGIALGYLKDGGSTDPQVVRSRYANLLDKMKLVRMALVGFLVGGSLMCLIGVPMVMVIVGCIPLGLGITLIVVSIMLRARLAQNIKVLEAAYREHAATLQPAER
ncbi:MAG: hypothetical protein Q8L55_02410 [Phycisphaerales bacterium]|nr:hypothetical protein [Phycisphaerales bacterium]